MTGDFAIVNQGQVYGQKLGIMLAVSIVLHLFIFSVVIFLPGLTPSGDMDDIVYEVDLVDMPSNMQAASPPASKAEETAAKTETSAKRIDASEEKKTRIEVEKISISKKKTAVKKVETTPKTEKNAKSEDANHLSQAISDLKKKSRSEENQQTHLDQAISNLQNKVSGTGSSTAASGTGAIGSLAMRIYQETVKSHIEDNWSYPAAIQNRKDLEVTVNLKIREDGTIMKYEFVKKSGDSIFDQSVLKAVERSNPIPPFPEGYEKSYDEFEFRFSLKELMDN
jgi:colicin import membrane protein